MNPPELRAEQIHLWRGDRHVLRGVSCAITGGRGLQVTGPNGAGKTSLLRTLIGLMRAESGRVLWNGLDTNEDARAFHAQLAYLGHDAPLKADLTAQENLWFACGVRRAVSREEVSSALERVGATAFADRACRTLSAGQRRRVALAGLLLASVPLWVLDEPVTNLDAEGQALVTRLIESHLSSGGLVIAAVHHSLGLPPDRMDELRLGAR